VFGQTDLGEACGEDPSFVCRQTLELTNSETVAELVDNVLHKPLRIAFIVVGAWIIVRLLRRAIDRLTLSLAGQEPSGAIRRGLRRAPLTGLLPDGVLEQSDASLRAEARAHALGSVLTSIMSVTVWVIAGIMILGELGFALGPLIASAGIAGVALGFGAQSLVKDFIAGNFILAEDQYGVGDIIDVGEISATPVSGTVEAVSLRTTRLRDVKGTVWYVPNGTVLRVGNMSQQWARALLDVAVTYDADLAVAEAAIKAAADSVWHDPDWEGQILEEPEVWGIEDLGLDGLAIRLVVKTQPSEQFKVLRELRRRIKAALQEAGVSTPAQQRMLWAQRDPKSAP